MLTYANKQTLVAEFKQLLEPAQSILVADFTGVSVYEMTRLRAKAREENVHIQVMKNTLLKKAVEDTQFQSVSPAFQGLSVVALSQEDPGAAARIFVDFIKEFDKMDVKGMCLGNELIPGDQLKRIAKLPTRLQALSMLARFLKTPATHLVCGLKDAPARLVRVLHARHEAMASS
ncbi:MAG: 50S ribosomal protein L10 [Legionellales bacterium]|nr:50S ribosomal protein L10 [Legionellales bacterium]|tara:strand:- start:97 stop:621 length:525 start_codon:yes stop_codon:yes gene_type:complete